MKKLLIAALCLSFLPGCAPSLKQIDRQEALGQGANATYAYGFVRAAGYSGFEIGLKDAQGNWRKYSQSWFKVPFQAKEFLVAFPMPPGRWNLRYVLFKNGGQSVVPMQSDRLFEVLENHGNYLGNFESTGNPSQGFISFNGVSLERRKSETDSLMAGEYASFDPAHTVAVRYEGIR